MEKPLTKNEFMKAEKPDLSGNIRATLATPPSIVSVATTNSSLSSTESISKTTAISEKSPKNIP